MTNNQVRLIQRLARERQVPMRYATVVDLVARGERRALPVGAASALIRELIGAPHR